MNQRPPGHRVDSSHWMREARRLAWRRERSWLTTHSSIAPPATSDSTCLAQEYTCAHAAVQAPKVRVDDSSCGLGLQLTGQLAGLGCHPQPAPVPAARSCLAATAR